MTGKRDDRQTRELPRPSGLYALFLRDNAASIPVRPGLIYIGKARDLLAGHDRLDEPGGRYAPLPPARRPLKVCTPDNDFTDTRETAVGCQTKAQLRALYSNRRAKFGCIQSPRLRRVVRATDRRIALPVWRSRHFWQQVLSHSATRCAHRATGKPA